MQNAAQENWQTLLSLFPAQWRERAVESGAIERLRGFSSAEALLRTLLLHIANGLSLRETAVQAKLAHLANVSDVALLEAAPEQRGVVAQVVRGPAGRD